MKLPPKADELAHAVSDDYFGLILEVMDEAAARSTAEGLLGKEATR